MSYYEEDYEEDYRDEDEIEQDIHENTTEVKIMEDNKLNISFDMENMAKGIVTAVKAELKDTLKQEIMRDIRNEIVNEIKEDIKTNTFQIVQDIMKNIYETEIIKVGGGWKEEPKQYTMKEYVIEQVKEAIVNNTASKNGSYSERTFSDWFTSKCVDPEIKRIIDNEINMVRKDINSKVKNMFDTSTKEMLSGAVLSVLMANETYKKIEDGVARIADKS